MGRARGNYFLIGASNLSPFPYSSLLYDGDLGPFPPPLGRALFLVCPRPWGLGMRYSAGLPGIAGSRARPEALAACRGRLRAAGVLPFRHRRRAGHRGSADMGRRCPCPPEGAGWGRGRRLQGVGRGQGCPRGAVAEPVGSARRGIDRLGACHGRQDVRPSPRRQGRGGGELQGVENEKRPPRGDRLAVLVGARGFEPPTT